jgi:hypothetical protein
MMAAFACIQLVVGTMFGSIVFVLLQAWWMYKGVKLQNASTNGDKNQGDDEDE